MRIQRSAICTIVAPAGTRPRNSSTNANPGVVVHAGERLAHVERLAVAVEQPVVGCVERGLLAHLARQQARSERNSGQDPHVAAPGLGQEVVGGPLAEHVEDDLDEATPGTRWP